MVEQPGRKQPPTLLTTRAGDAQISADEDAAKVRIGPRIHPQPLSQERHLVDRQTYKTRRSAALAEWQSLVS